MGDTPPNAHDDAGAFIIKRRRVVLNLAAFPERLVEAMEMRGLNVSSLARRIAADGKRGSANGLRTRLSSYLNRRATPPQRIRQRIAEALGVTVAALCTAQPLARQAERAVPAAPAEPPVPVANDDEVPALPVANDDAATPSLNLELVEDKAVVKLHLTLPIGVAVQLMQLVEKATKP